VADDPDAQLFGDDTPKSSLDVVSMRDTQLTRVATAASAAGNFAALEAGNRGAELMTVAGRAADGLASVAPGPVVPPRLIETIFSRPDVNPLQGARFVLDADSISQLTGLVESGGPLCGSRARCCEARRERAWDESRDRRPVTRSARSKDLG